MKLNQNSRFAINPTNIDIGRSKFGRSHTHKLSFNEGEIVPIYIDEVLPGDTKSVDTNVVMRLSTLIAPIMDNIYVDTYFFFVPWRLVWSHSREFFGENTAGSWAPQVTYEIPQVTAPDNGWAVGTIADQLGIPTGVPNLSVSALPFRSVALVYDQWFRDENLQDPFNIPLGDVVTAGSNGNTYITDVVKGGKPFIAAKFFDYFTSALPAPQKGPSVPLPVSMASVEELPVWGNGITNFYYTGTDSLPHYGNLNSRSNNTVYFSNASSTTSGSAYYLGLVEEGQFTGVDSGLYADASGLSLTIGTINELRTAFQIQKFYERQARGGSRYIEFLKSHFGVTSPDARLQRSEFLGAKRFNLNINQVIQNSETNTTPQGTAAAYSLTAAKGGSFTKSFVEHGYVLGFAVARHDHSYQQGLEKFWTKKTLFDFYLPEFANIGELPIYNREIYAQGSGEVNPDSNVPYDDEVFGYQEAWAEYRYKPSYVTGEMRSTATNSLDVWHLGDEYNSLPHLSDTWIAEDKTTLDRVLAVTSNVSNQIIADFYFQETDVRPMPMYSIPGLIDHH